MKSISFSNFRKFIEFPEIQLGGITYLVGTNNSGKSSFAKAVMLCLRNLRSTGRGCIGMRRATFYYDVTGANVGSFERALSKKAKPFDSDGENSLYSMDFKFTLSSVEFAFNIISDRKDYMSTTAADVNIININDLALGISYIIDYSSNTIDIKLEDKSKHISFQLLDNIKDPNIPTIARIIESIERKYLNNEWEDLVPEKLEDYTEAISPNFVFTEDIIDPDSIVEDTEMFKNEDNCDEYYSSTEDDSTKKYIDMHKQEFKLSLEHIKDIVMSDHYIFIPSHLASQRVMLIPDNRNDYIAQVAKEFKRMNIQANNKFIKTWMDESHLCIGKNFNVITERGEAYRIEITNFQNERMDLAEAGRGSVQMMVLLLKFATIIAKYGEKKEEEKPLIVIEEPEQNLHPKMQSKISDLLLFMNEKYGYRFLVETHSEYVIRSTQVSVAKKHYKNDKELKKNPIVVYYFEDSKPTTPFYKMKYRKDGNFENEFGEGFYDEASNLLFEIL